MFILLVFDKNTIKYLHFGIHRLQPQPPSKKEGDPKKHSSDRLFRRIQPQNVCHCATFFFYSDCLVAHCLNFDNVILLSHMHDRPLGSISSFSSHHQKTRKQSESWEMRKKWWENLELRHSRRCYPDWNSLCNLNLAFAIKEPREAKSKVYSSKS